MKKIFLILLISMALAGAKASANPTVTFTAAQLGVTVPLTITPGQAVTFTVDTMTFTELQVYASIYVTSSAAANSCLIGVMPCTSSGALLMATNLLNLTLTAGSAQAGLSPLAAVAGSENLISFKNYAQQNSTSSWVFSMIGATGAFTTAAGNTDQVDTNSPKVMFVLINSDASGKNTAGFAFYITNLLVYAKIK